jgi:hypothetical protein
LLFGFTISAKLALKLLKITGNEPEKLILKLPYVKINKDDCLEIIGKGYIKEETQPILHRFINDCSN